MATKKELAAAAAAAAVAKVDTAAQAALATGETDVAKVDQAAQVVETKAKSKLAKIESVTLASYHAFMDDAGQVFSWVEGQVETDAEKIAMLIERKSPIVATASKVAE